MKPEMLKQMKEFLHEIETQNNRATAAPYYYVVMEKREVPTADGIEEAGCTYVDSEGDYYTNDKKEMLDHLLEYYDDEVDWESEFFDEKADIDFDLDDCYDDNFRTLCEHLNIEKVAYRIERHVSDFTPIFFTEKEAKQWIDNNRHNLSDDVYDYVKCARGSNEITRMFEFLKVAVEELS